MKKPIILGLTAALTLSACAGRDPDPVQAVQPGDDRLTCTQLRSEISANSQAIRGLLDEQLKKKGNNTAAGVAGAVVFVPVLLFMDLKGAAGEEARAYQRRNQGLLKRYEAKGCRPEIKMETYDAREARKAAKNAETEAKTAETE